MRQRNSRLRETALEMVALMPSNRQTQKKLDLKVLLLIMLPSLHQAVDNTEQDQEALSLMLTQSRAYSFSTEFYK